MYLDVCGKVEAHNKTTGDHLELDLTQRTWRNPPKMTGFVKDG